MIFASIDKPIFPDSDPWYGHDWLWWIWGISEKWDLLKFIQFSRYETLTCKLQQVSPNLSSVGKVWQDLLLKKKKKKEEEGREGTKNNACAACLKGPGIEPGTSRGLGKRPEGVLAFQKGTGVWQKCFTMLACRMDQHQIWELVELIFVWRKCCFQKWFLAQMRLPGLDFGRFLGLGTEKFTNFRHFEQKIGKFCDFWLK